MPVVINRSGGGDSSSGKGKPAPKPAPRKPGGKRKADAPGLDEDKIKLIALVAVTVLALAAVGWWFLGGHSSKPDVNVAQPGPPQVQAGAPLRTGTGSAMGPGVGGFGGPRRGLEMSGDQGGAPAGGGAPNAPRFRAGEGAGEEMRGSPGPE